MYTCWKLKRSKITISFQYKCEVLSICVLTNYEKCKMQFINNGFHMLWMVQVMYSVDN